MHKLTIIIPLKNRSYYTKEYLKTLNNKYLYIFADGSDNNNNQKLFQDLNYKNVTYVKYSEDKTIDIYIDKINKVLKLVKTPYVLFSDNDDFILERGLDKSIEVLENKENDFICSGGKILAILQKNDLKSTKYSLPFILFDNSCLHGLNGKKDLIKNFKNYHYLYYSVYKRDYIVEFWKDIKNINLNHITLIEIFLTISTLLNGKYYDVGESHYMRLRNPYSSSDKSENPYGRSHTLKIFFDTEYRDLVYKMSDFICNKYNIDKIEFLEDLKYFYINNYNISFQKKIKKNLIFKTVSYLKNLFFINKLRILDISFIKNFTKYL